MRDPDQFGWIKIDFSNRMPDIKCTLAIVALSARVIHFCHFRISLKLQTAGSGTLTVYSLNAIRRNVTQFGSRRAKCYSSSQVLPAPLAEQENTEKPKMMWYTVICRRRFIHREYILIQWSARMNEEYKPIIKRIAWHNFTRSHLVGQTKRYACTDVSIVGLCLSFRFRKFSGRRAVPHLDRNS